MSTFNTTNQHATNGANVSGSSLNCLSSPENIRSIFFTNLLLLGIQEHSSNPTETLLLESSFGVSSSRYNPQLPSTQSGHYIFIESKSFGVHGAKPLEFHKNIFAKGHQSSKALEFVLWFLFSRLDFSLTRERFKECWPILDRHHAREFRNIAFKWLDELRKEGCFGIGHNIYTSYQQATGLGVFLPTIRRSYLDESIGERIDQLITMLSTYVLSKVITRDINASATKHSVKELDLVGAVPEIADEERILKEIDLQIIERTRLFINVIQQQKEIRQSWSSISNEMTEKLHTFDKELTRVESERQTFLEYQPQLAERTSKLTLSELHVLENRWIEKINAQWEPILTFVERRVGRDEVIRSLIGSQARNGNASFDDQSASFNISRAIRTLSENATVKIDGSLKGDLGTILGTWKRSLRNLEDNNPNILPENQIALQSKQSLDSLSNRHRLQLVEIRELKQRLEKRLKESSGKVDILQREKTISQQPYKRLLSTLRTDNPASDTLDTNSPSKMRNLGSYDAVKSSRIISSAFELKSNSDNTLDTRIGDIRRQVKSFARQNQDQGMSSHSKLQGTIPTKDAIDILYVKTPAVKYTPASLSRSRKFDDGMNKSSAEDIKLLALSRDNVSTMLLPPTNKPQKPVTFSKSIIKPPPSIFGRSTTKVNYQTDTTNQDSSSFLSPKRPSARHIPEVVSAKRNGQDDSSQSIMYNEIISSLVGISSASMTPPKPKFHLRTYSDRTSVTQQSTSSKSNPQGSSTTLESKRTKAQSDFLASIFKRAGLQKEVIAANRDSSTVSDSFNFNGGPQHSHTSSNLEDLKGSQAELAILESERSVSKSQIPSFLRQSFKEQLGASRKRRQSSESLGGQDGVTNPVVVESEVVQQKELTTIFKANENENEMPRTPSKRQRIGLFDQLVTDQQSPFNFSLTTSTNESPIKTSGIFGASYLKKSPGYASRKFTLSNLTLDDLRAPTPKPIKSKLTENKSTLPIMFLNTPQRKQLSMETASSNKGSPIFLLHSSKSSPFISPKSNLKRHDFSSSIFSRFNAGDDPTTNKSQMEDESDSDYLRHCRESPESQSYPSSPLQRKSYRLSIGPLSKPMAETLLESSNMADFITGESNFAVQQQRSSDIADSATSNENSIKTNISNLDTCSGSSLESNTATEFARDILGGSTMSISGSDISTGRNPWGRPPSWKPKSPRMVDMEKKRHLAQTYRRSTSDTVPLNSSIGSLKVSVYGRSNISVPSSLSPTFSSSVSTKSIQSDIGLANSQSYDMIEVGGIPRNRGSNTDIILGKMAEESDGDTREFISPPVSPIGKVSSGRNRSLSASAFSLHTQRDTNGAPGTMFHFGNLRNQKDLSKSVIVTGSARPISFGKTPISLGPRDDKVLNGRINEKVEIKDHAIHTNKKFLEDPIQEGEFLDNSHGEDETILNQALQTIFDSKGTPSSGSISSKNHSEFGFGRFSDSTGEHNGSRSLFALTEHESGKGDMNGGLFDEMMPEALDLEEALWENTESFP